MKLKASEWRKTDLSEWLISAILFSCRLFLFHLTIHTEPIPSLS